MDPWKMTETELRAEVLKLCADRDLWPVALRPEKFNQREVCNKGFPDLMVYGAGGVLFRELKAMKGSLASAQSTWKNRLLSGGHDWSVWTPADLGSGRIASELEALEAVGACTNEFTFALIRRDC